MSTALHFDSHSFAPYRREGGSCFVGPTAYVKCLKAEGAAGQARAGRPWACPSPGGVRRLSDAAIRGLAVSARGRAQAETAGRCSAWRPACSSAQPGPRPSPQSVLVPRGEVGVCTWVCW